MQILKEYKKGEDKRPEKAAAAQEVWGALG
jgi:hypothetical protein